MSWGRWSMWQYTVGGLYTRVSRDQVQSLLLKRTSGLTPVCGGPV